MSEHLGSDASRQRLRLRWGAASDQGIVREQNQDAIYAGPGLFVVADGMGGHLGGSVASDLAVKTVAANSPRNGKELLRAFQHANSVVHRWSRARADLSGMGTTLCAIAVDADSTGHSLSWANVGDSRIYLQRDGTLTQMTLDHSYVAELIHSGKLTPQQAATHKQRNTLTRAVGVLEKVNVDVWNAHPMSGDRYLLCTDGVTNEIPESDIAGLMTLETKAPAAARALVRLANDNGGRDNATALVVDVTVEPPTAPEGIEHIEAMESAAAQPVRPQQNTQTQWWSRWRSRARKR